jgi:DNA-binding response OmpR family regulator
LSEVKPTKILIVDDDDAIRNMVERVLRRERFEVESARDGFEAIEKLSRNEYGTILLDLMMPRVDGHGVLQFLDQSGKPTPPAVIVMSANLQSALETTRVPAVRRVLPKPFDIRELVAHVRECCGLPAPPPAPVPLNELA